MSKVLNSPTLRILEQKREELAAIFKGAAVEQNGETVYNLSDDQLVEVNKRNDELAELNDKFESERKAYQIALDNERALKESREATNKLPHPKGSEDQKPSIKSLGELFTESDQYKGRFGGTFKGAIEIPGVELKTLMSTTAGFAPFVNRQDRVELYPNRRLVLADIIPSSPTSESSIKYMEETTHTNNTAPTAEGSDLGENALAFTERTIPIEQVGSWLPVTMQQLEDVPGLRTLIDSRLMYMLGNEEEDSLINDDGSTPNLQGFLQKTGVQTQARGSLPAPDAILKAFTKIRGINAGTGFAEPSAVVFHPTDFEGIQLLRTADGIYIWGHPADNGVQRIWGKPVVVTPVIAQGTALAGDFQMFSQIFRKEGVRIEITDSHGTYFIANKFVIKIFERIALAIFRPTAFCKVTGL